MSIQLMRCNNRLCPQNVNGVFCIVDLDSEEDTKRTANSTKCTVFVEILGGVA